MTTWAVMRQLGKARRLQADSDPEVVRDFARAAIDLEGVLRFNGRVLKPGPLLNALAVWWLSRDEAERLEIAREGLTLLEAKLTPGPIESAPAGPPVVDVVMTREEVAKPASAVRKKRSG